MSAEAITHGPSRLPSSRVRKELTGQEVHVWLAVLDDAERDFRRLMQTLSTDELIRAKRFRFEQDRKRFIARRGILRRILARYTGIEARNIRFSIGDQGKPELAGVDSQRSVHFNLSHSRNLALSVFSRYDEVGVDIEADRDVPERDQIVERLFTPEEKKSFRALPSNRRREGFLEHWTRKEALLKGKGEGLSRTADAVGTGLTPGTERSERGPEWSVHSLRLVRGYAAAVAVKRKNVTLSCFTWTCEEEVCC